MATGGTNLGPRSEVLIQDVRKQIALLRKEGITPTPDLVTTSGSGVDPDISPADAYAQASAVASARDLPAAAVRRLIAKRIVQPQFGFLGSAYINVLQLNQALAAMR
jgi:K+-transporting ATPase ATPase C chain